MAQSKLQNQKPFIFKRMQRVKTFQICNNGQVPNFEPYRYLIKSQDLFYPDDVTHISQQKVGPRDKIMAFYFSESVKRISTKFCQYLNTIKRILFNH